MPYILPAAKHPALRLPGTTRPRLRLSMARSERCKQRLMDVLQERRLRLSRKKTRIGSIDKGFHFLGINYLEPQPPDGTNVSQNSSDSAHQKQSEHYLTSMGGTVQLQLIIQILCIKRSFHMRERYERHANKLSKWLLMESLSAESRVTCVVGARGGENSTKLALSRPHGVVYSGLLG